MTDEHQNKYVTEVGALFKGWLLVLTLTVPFLAAYMTWESNRTDRFRRCIDMKHVPSECSRHTKP